MPLTSRLASLWRTLFRRKRLENDLDDELRGYLEELTDKKVREGLDPPRRAVPPRRDGRRSSP